MDIEQTIAAISTPAGFGGISIVKISGNNAFQICDEIFKRPENKSFFDQKTGSICYGHIIDTDGVLDEVLVSKMAAPATYTREDIVEINCHGGINSAREVLNAVIRRGARLAEPGEFTKKAFLNGRIDLTQAEAVSDLIMAKTELSAKVAMSQLDGKLSGGINTIKSEIISLLAQLEVTIQYPEYDIEDLTESELLNKLESIQKSISDLLATFKKGEILKEGLKVVIAGKPNVGKSMLLNSLIDKEKSIVTNIPGTTRDIIDEYINLRGIPVRIFDTAGIRNSTDPIESIGIERTLMTLNQADIVLLVVDSSQTLDDQDLLLFEKISEQNHIYILNKSDLEQEEKTIAFFSDKEHILISAYTKKNIDILIEKLFEKALLNEGNDDVLISNIRHRNCLHSALNAVNESIVAVTNGTPVDFAETDIRDSLYHLGKITGETADEDIINEIFSNFCLGK